MVPDKNRKFHWGQQFSSKFDFNYFSYLNPMLFTIAIRYVIPLGGCASRETVWEFDVSTVPGILNTPDPPNSEQCGVPGHSNSPTAGILSGARGGLIFRLNETKKQN